MRRKKLTQPYFNKSKIRRIAVAICAIASLLVLAAWLFKEAKIIHFDWSFTLPAISLIASLIPVGSATVDWFEKRVNAIDDRLSLLEPTTVFVKELASTIKSEHEDLRYCLLRQEAKLEQIRDTLNKLDLPKIVAENKRLIKKLQDIELTEAKKKDDM